MLDGNKTVLAVCFLFFQVASAQRARAHGEAMMKRCREATLGKVNELSWWSLLQGGGHIKDISSFSREGVIPYHSHIITMFF